MANWKLKELRGERRRTFLKMCGVAAAAVGVERSKLLNFLADEGGHGLAEAAGTSYGRSLLVPSPNGVQAWFQEMWMFPEVAIKACGTNFGSQAAWLYCPQRGYNNNYLGTYAGPARNDLPGTVKYFSAERGMFYSPDAPWFDHSNGVPIYPVTGIMSGSDETHTEFPVSSIKLSGTSSLLAAAGSLGAVGSSAIVPVLGIDPVRYGTAPGAPDVTTVPNAGGLVDLFNSAASQFTLSSPVDQELFSTYYKALLSLRGSSGRSSWAPEMAVTKNAARIIGLNFSSQLTPTEQDLIDFGISDLLAESVIDSRQRSGLEAFGRTLVIVAKAFRLGLSKSAIVALSPGPTSDDVFTDPHVTFNNTTTMQQGRNTVKYLARFLDGFYRELAKWDDPESPSEKLDRTTTFIAYGDTPHTPLRGAAWPDATPDACNYMWVMDPKGNIKSGWFGNMYTDRVNGRFAHGFNPETGAETPTPTVNNSAAASTAAAFAIAQGDVNKVSEFGGPPIGAMINKKG